MVNHLTPNSPRALSVLRIVIGILFFAHGIQKIVGFPVPPPHPVEMMSLIGFAGALEVIGGAFILLGLNTRMTAFVLSGEMAFAYFMRTRARASILWSMAATPRYSTVSRSCISYFPGPGYGAWMPECSGATRRNPHLSVI